MSFAEFFLEEGIDLELGLSLDDVISFLDRSVPSFDFGGHSYRLEPVNGVIGTNWNLAVMALDPAVPDGTDPAVAFIQVEEEEGDGEGTGLKVLSREMWEESEPPSTATEEELKLFSHFAFQLLNALSAEGLIHLPAPLPIE